MRNLKHSPIVLAILATTAALGTTTPSRAQSTGAATNPTATQTQEITIIGTVSSLRSLDFYAPNSSAVLKREDIDAQGARKLDQALQYQAGVLGEPFGADNKVEWFKIRGFDASISLDGSPTAPTGFFVWKPEIFGVESVEVLKGPNSLVFGASESGGVVNLITKRPHKKQALEVNAEVGQPGRLGLSADYNGLANSDGSVYYRVVAQVRKEDGSKDHTDMESVYFAPSITFDFSKQTSLTLLASLQREDGRPTNGFLPAYGTITGTPYGLIDRDMNPGEPDFDRLKRTQTSLGWMFSHKLNKDWTFAQNYKFQSLDLDQRNVFAYGSDGDRQLLRGYTLSDGDTKTHYLDHRVRGNLRLGEEVRLRPTFGIDYVKSETSGQNNGFGLVPNMDMFAPVYGAPFSVSATPYELKPEQWAAYGSAELLLGSRWSFSAGVRHDRAKNSGNISGADAGYKVNHTSMNVGAMYVSDAGIAPYITYSESFKPISGVDGSGNVYRPYEGQQAEVGVKLEPSWLDGTITLAYFNVKEKNALISDASNIQTQTGKRTNKGIELQADLKLTRATSLKAAYTHNDSRQDITATQTVRTPLLPNDQASLWVSHRFDLAGAQKLTVAAGARYNGSVEDQRYHPGIGISSYTLLDLMLRYDIDRNWALQVNARNLSDKTYVSGCDFYCYYGGRRTVDAQLRYQWR